MSAIIGALRAELSASIAQFQNDMGKAADALKGFSKQASQISRDLDSVGKKMSIAITAPLALLAKASLDQAKQAREAIGQVEAALISSGGASGRTAPQLALIAKQLQNISVFDDDDILRNVTANLLTFGNIQGPIFDRAQKAVVNLASRMGGDLAGSAIKVGRALNDPIGGVSALTRLGISFTTQQKLQIIELVKNGDGLKAQGIILDALSAKYDGAALALRKAAPDAQLTQGWRDFEETIGHILIQVLPPLVDALTDMLDAFQSLSPGMQKFIIITLGVVAAVGPLLVLLGSLVSTVATLAPLVYGLALAWGAVLIPVLAAVAAFAALEAAIYYAEQISTQAAAALQAQDDAHKNLTSTMQTAALATRDMTKAERDAASQKLKLAEATLKAAIAQEQQNLAEDVAKQSRPWLQRAGGAAYNLLHGMAPPAFRVVSEQTALKQLQDQLGQNLADQALLGAPSPFAPGAGAPPPKLNFDLHNEADIKKAADAAKALEQAITQTNNALAHGLDDLDLPKATSQANAFNAKIDDFVKRAQDAGVNTGKWSGQVATLRARVEELRQAGLAKEAIEFSQAVNADQIAVDRFAKGGLPPLQQKLQEVDDQFKSLSDKINEEIAQNSALADSNDVARKAMERLKAILAGLPAAHDLATKAAKAQASAEQDLADLAAKSQLLTTSNAIRDIKQSTSPGSPISSRQADLQAATDDLASKQIEVATTLRKMEQDREDAVLQGRDADVKNLDAEIALQQELYDLVTKTTADQIQATGRINEAFKSFTDSLTDSLSDAIATWTFDLNGLRNIFAQLAEQLFIKPVIGAGADLVSGFLKNLATSFAGAHAAGGYIPPGQWGIVGERGPEPAFGGTSGMEVHPHGSMMGGGVTQVFNISTPDANSFRRSQRQIQRTAKSRLAVQ